MFQPLKELIDRYSNVFYKSIMEFMVKLIKMQYIIEGVFPPKEIDLRLVTSNEIVPSIKSEKIDEIIKLKNEGLITEQEAQDKIQPFINIEGAIA